MRRRAIVVHPPLSVHREFIDYPYFSDLGAVQLASAIRSRGHGVALVDGFALPGSNARWRDDGRCRLGAAPGELLEAVSLAAEDLGGADVIAIALTPFHRPPARCDLLGEVAAGLRDAFAHAAIVLADCYQSGQHYLEAPADALLAAYPEADAWVKYEAEETVPALIGALAERGERPRGVYRGLSPAPLDGLPIPAWDLIDLDLYFSFHQRVVEEIGRGSWAFPIDGRTVPAISSRGCPFDCLHCSANPGRQEDDRPGQRRYSPAALRAYLEELVRVCRPTRIALLDELANASRPHFDALLEILIDLDLHFEIPNGLRADRLEARDFQRMQGRVTTVSVSAESGSQRVVDEIVGKRLDLGRVEETARVARESGTPLLVHFLIGLPGETAREINQTLELAVRLHERYGAHPSVQYATPLPGTRLAGHAEASEVEDWAARLQTAPSPELAGVAVSAEELSKFKWTFEKRLKASAGPSKLILNLTYQCNNHCRFCAVGNRASVHGDAERYRRWLDQYRDAGVRMVDFDGGEPTLHPDLIPLIGYARKSGFDRVAVTTNGRRCFYPEFARTLVSSGLTTLLVSLHGPDAATHAREVGVPEAYEQTVRGIENCVAHAPADVELGMNVTVTRDNWSYLDAMAALCHELGLRSFNIQFLTPFGRATREVAPPIEAAAERAMRVADDFGDRLRVQVINLPFCYLPGHEHLAAGDLLKLERHMVFVNDHAVNLATYLAERRAPSEQCASCAHAIFCGGFYQLEEVPEPPWTPSGETGDSSSVP